MDSAILGFLIFIVISCISLPIIIVATRLLMRIRKFGLEHLVVLSDDGVGGPITLADSGLSIPWLAMNIFGIIVAFLSMIATKEHFAPAFSILGVLGLVNAVALPDLRGVISNIKGPSLSPTITIDAEVVNPPHNRTCLPTLNRKRLNP